MAKAIDLNGTEYDYSKEENRRRFPQFFGFPNGVTSRNKNKGQPTIFTPEIAAKLRQAFEISATDLEACRFAGISAEALYNHQRKYPEYVKYKEWLRETPDLAARNLVANAAQKNLSTAQWWLERRKKAEFSTRSEVTGADGNALSPEQPQVLTTLLKVTEALQRNAKGNSVQHKPANTSQKPKKTNIKPKVSKTKKEADESERENPAPSQPKKQNTTSARNLRKEYKGKGN